MSEQSLLLRQLVLRKNKSFTSEQSFHRAPVQSSFLLVSSTQSLAAPEDFQSSSWFGLSWDGVLRSSMKPGLVKFLVLKKL